ncbi:saccharopine dehydrogenase [Nocardioides sp. MAH-18]|uniref:Saccharopine dehydrogenase n=1 Tax=Nocardioides agri TaxID=2682843 RepID=A0A6L6XVZ3_9ACTN|nr:MULTISPECIES: saccharopine dehydrogenase NADP-binding domain-containing protein [unclassified Nocardioides]MBA2955806.1 saccharopine dehydrogenase NADP-binding domain-containing protein [Nocardioides sp. CGMCC 1.13656]MVQ50656.1 saccharopine dehydrogenase [Nocardioides sp. MAH-18]
MAAARELDLVLFGATGFTGALTADYLARHAPAGLRWALAGRSQAKLEALRERLGVDVPLLTADATDPASLADVARRTRLVITTVGPYIDYGEPLVAACAEAGTDYVDLTGEPEFVDRMYLAHHAAAERSGARIVHACGFDSVPYDLGVLHAVQELQAGGPVTVRGVVRAGAQFSGGTFHSAMTAFSRARQHKSVSAERRRVEPRPEGRRARAVPGKPHRDPLLGYWLMPLPTIDPIVVARSGAALASYGPDFRYSHYAGTKTLRYAAGGAAAAGAMVLAAQVPPLRRLALGRIRPGDGPSEARRARSWFTVDVVAEGDGRTVHTRVSGGDPGYDETAKMLAESALCLLLDDNPPTAGQVTTAQAMGTALLARLQAAGIGFEVLSGPLARIG